MLPSEKLVNKLEFDTSFIKEKFDIKYANNLCCNASTLFNIVHEKGTFYAPLYKQNLKYFGKYVFLAI